MITLVASTTTQTMSPTVLPLGLRDADGRPIVFGKVHRQHMAVFTKDVPEHIRRMLADQIMVGEQRQKYTQGAQPSRSVSQIPIPFSEGIRLDGNQPGKLALVSAGGDAEHVVFATITSGSNTRLSVFKSNLDFCQVVHCAVEGTNGEPSAVIMAVGFNCKHLDGLAVVVKIKEAGKSLVELRVITPNGIYNGVINEEVFEMFVKKDQTVDLPSLMEKSAVRKRMSWSAVA